MRSRRCTSAAPSFPRELLTRTRDSYSRGRELRRDAISCSNLQAPRRSIGSQEISEDPASTHTKFARPAEGLWIRSSAPPFADVRRLSPLSEPQGRGGSSPSELPSGFSSCRLLSENYERCELVRRSKLARGEKREKSAYSGLHRRARRDLAPAPCRCAFPKVDSKYPSLTFWRGRKEGVGSPCVSRAARSKPILSLSLCFSLARGRGGARERKQNLQRVPRPPCSSSSFKPLQLPGPGADEGHWWSGRGKDLTICR